MNINQYSYISLEITKHVSHEYISHRRILLEGNNTKKSDTDIFNGSTKFKFIRRNVAKTKIKLISCNISCGMV